MTCHLGKTKDTFGKFKAIDCNECGFVHLNPIPSNRLLRKIYSSSYYEAEKPLYMKRGLEDLKWWETVYQDRLETIEKFTRIHNKRLLELGSGPGFFLKFIKKKGWKVFGIEPSQKASNFSKKGGVEIINSFYEDIDLERLGKFDAVVMYEFLEHIPNPAEALEFAYKVLNKGGIVSIGVPNDYNPLQEVVKKTLGVKPYWIAPPFHINYFSTLTLGNLLNKHGFKVVYEETSFPLEMFLLMGEMYLGNDKVGREIHGKRKRFDLYLSKFNNELKRALYKDFAKLGIGRNLTIYAKK